MICPHVTQNKSTSCQPMQIVDRVVRRVMDVEQSFGVTWSNEDGPTDRFSDDDSCNEMVSGVLFRTVSHPSLEAEVPASMDLNVVRSRSRNVTKLGRPIRNVTKLGRPIRNVAIRGRPLKNAARTGRPLKHAAKMGRLSMNVSKIGRPNRNVAERGRVWRFSRFDDMTYRTSFEDGEVYHRFPSSHELEVATELTSEGDERPSYSIRWHNYGDWTSSSEIHDEDYMEALPIQCFD